MLLLFVFRSVMQKDYNETEYINYRPILDSMNISIQINNKIVSKLKEDIDSITTNETTIINNYENIAQDILDYTISDDSVALFIANQISNKQQDILLLYP